MKKLLFVLLLVPMLGWAQSPFDGTWKVDMANPSSPKSPMYISCRAGCTIVRSAPRRSSVKADGEFQKVSGDPYR